jgi:DNA-binding CsgD family transcriptional regulator
MNRGGDPIGLVEAAYRWTPDTASWLDGLVEASQAYDVGGGVAAYTISITREKRASEARGSEAALKSAMQMRRATEKFPLAIAKLAYAPTEHVGNVGFRLARLSRESGVDLQPITKSLPPAWALLAGDPERESLALVFPRAGTVGSVDEAFPHRDRKHLGHVGAHIGAALRLRALLQPSTTEHADAVLAPDGAVLHARGDTKEKDVRTSLARAVMRSERARGKMRRSDPDEAIKQWTALVQGRWTLVDTIETDGKRFVLARANPVHARDPIALTTEESAVAWLAACGHSYKYIAYELGFTLGVTTSRLRSAMKKLRVKSRSELLAKIGISR